MKDERIKIVALMALVFLFSIAAQAKRSDRPAPSQTASGASIVEENEYDFKYDGIYYNIISESKQTVEVTYLYRMHDKNCLAYEGTIVIPEKVTYRNVDYTVTKIGDCAFYACENLLSVTIPKYVTSVGEHSFQECLNLRAVRIAIGSQLKTLGNESFRLCSNLHSIVIPDSVTTIGNYAFSGCAKLEKAVVPNSVTTMGTFSFYSCFDLKSITIGNSVTSIGRYSFIYCRSLESITVLNPVPPTCPKGSFTSSKKSKDLALYVPAGCSQAYGNAEIWKDFGSIREIEEQ